MQVHKETIDKIPGALPGRDSTEIEIYGMQGIPEDAVRGAANPDHFDEGPSMKRPRMDAPPAGGIPMPSGMMPPPGMPGFPPPFAMPGMPPFPPPPGMPGMPPFPPGMGMPPMPPGYGGGRGMPPNMWGGGGPAMPPQFPPRLPTQSATLSGESTVPSSYSDRLAQERADRAPIPEGPLQVPSTDAFKRDADYENKPAPPPSAAAALGAKIRIIHPDDHSLSLEEHRLQRLMMQRAAPHMHGDGGYMHHHMGGAQPPMHLNSGYYR